MRIATIAVARSRVGRRRLDERGNLTVEFAFVVPLLVLLSFGAFELGHVLLEHLRVAGAARAGLQYGLQDHSTAGDFAAIARAAQAGAGARSSGYEVTARGFCTCAAGVEVACGTSCTDRTDLRSYLEVKVVGNVPPLVSYPLSPGSWRVSSTQSRRLN